VPRDADMLALLSAWVPAVSVREAILDGNAAAAYDFRR
jgi:predicted TIM-barrel fold metal-dependent hydrolase